ncbi:MAG TPA: ChbG/HpnK family deacetylase [Candidatus Methylomirabilis sp.]|nr:ChbG/HpnK family deacetylase [Candidatus Methylomirabilis sp.]
MRNLIVNADDLGWTESVNRGIAEAHRHGIVTSASLLANGPAFSSAVELARATPGLGVGVHLNLSDGPPVAEPQLVKSLLNERGELDATPESLLLRLARRGTLLEEVEREWNAQIRKVRDAGIAPAHVDGHRHVHMLPGLFEIAVRLGKKHGIGAIRISHEASSLRAALSSGTQQHGAVVIKQGMQARGLKLIARDARELAERAGLATADFFCGIAQTGELTRVGVVKLLQVLPEGTTEFMCHPGYADDALAKSPTRLKASRQTELQILTDTGIRNLVASRGIRLVDYAFVAQEA